MISTFALQRNNPRISDLNSQDLPEVFEGHYAGAAVSGESLKTLHYQRSRFTTNLPVDYLYTPSHCWVARHEGDLQRIGFTKFATRMLGEMVDHGFEAELNAPVTVGQIIGWIEGFKAISDLYCIAAGRFAGGNPALKEKITAVNKDPYGTGWLYLVNGKPDAMCVNVHSYCVLLDKTIDRILEKQAGGDGK